jgi:hypothetical protein
LRIPLLIADSLASDLLIAVFFLWEDIFTRIYYHIFSDLYYIHD